MTAAIVVLPRLFSLLSLNSSILHHPSPPISSALLMTAFQRCLNGGIRRPAHRSLLFLLLLLLITKHLYLKGEGNGFSCFIKDTGWRFLASLAATVIFALCFFSGF